MSSEGVEDDTKRVINGVQCLSWRDSRGFPERYSALSMQVVMDFDLFQDDSGGNQVRA